MNISVKRNYRSLQTEANLFLRFNGEEGFPRLGQFKKETTYNFTLMEHLGPDLDELLEKSGGRFSVKCVCIMAIQMISRLESLHKRDYVHRNIKPGNFRVGIRRRVNIIYLSDLSLSKRYRHAVTKVHIPYQEGKVLLGSVRYVN